MITAISLNVPKILPNVKKMTKNTIPKTETMPLEKAHKLANLISQRGGVFTGRLISLGSRMVIISLRPVYWAQCYNFVSVVHQVVK